MNSKTDKNATLHPGDDLTSLDNAYKEEPTEENYQKIRRYIPKNKYEIEQKRVILQQIEDERIKEKFHRLANFLPLMEEKELIELARDIKKNGLIHDIVMYEGKIIGGRNRYKACMMANVEPRFIELEEGIDPLAFVISENLHRRNLKRYNSAIRCNIALALLKDVREEAKKRQVATQLNGKTKNNDPKFKSSVVVTESPTEEHEQKGRSIEIVAKRMNLSPTTLKKVVKIMKVAKTDQEIAKQWEQAKKGKISINKVHEHATRNTSNINLKQEAIKKVIKRIDTDFESLTPFSYDDPEIQKAILFLKKAIKILSKNSSVVVTESSTEKIKNNNELLSGSPPDSSNGCKPNKSTKKMKIKVK